MNDNIIPDELLLVDLRAYLLNEISSLYFKLREIRTVNPNNITQQTVRMGELINTWRKYFKNEPYLMRVSVVDATHHDLWWSP